MSMTTTVSFLTQSRSQINRLSDLRVTLDNLQRQVTTQKKHTNFSGYGTETLTIQRLHTTKINTERYLNNIERVSMRMEMMSTNMTKISDLARDVVSALQLDGQNGQEGVDRVKLLAEQNLDFIQDILNTELDGRYLFAGSDATSQPFIDGNTLNSNFKTQVDNWLNGSQTTTQAINNTEGFTTANLGLAPGLTTSGAVTTRIDDSIDINYTVKADLPGFKDIIRAIAFVANLKYPDPAVDIPSSTDFDAVMGNVKTVLARGISGLNQESQKLSNQFNLLKTLKETHTSDLSIYQVQLDKIENVDAATAISQLQAIQTQLSAAYQVTSIVSELSLVNYM